MRPIRCICLDVDGVLTDGRITIANDGTPLRAFHIHDGFAMRWFQKLGGVILIVTGKMSDGVAHRMRELDVPDHRVVQGSSDKWRDLRQLLATERIDASETAVVGDDWPDAPLLVNCGFPIAVANADADVRNLARFVTTRCGGDGAVREAIEHVMRIDGTWAHVRDFYLRQAAVGVGEPVRRPAVCTRDEHDDGGAVATGADAP